MNSNSVKINPRNTKFSQTKKAMMAQYKRCYQSPVYFLRKYAVIQHPTRGSIPFDLYPFQQETLEDFVKHPWNIILKSRQLGISTLVAGYVLWLCNFQRDKSVLIIANVQDVAMNIIRKIRHMYGSLPSWLREQLVTDNKQSLFWNNDSWVKAASASPNAGVSEALSLLVFDEAAVLNQTLASQIWTSAQPTLSTGGDCIMLSTPRGIGSTFHRLWTEAQQCNNRFHTIKLKWDVHPQRDQAWREQQTKTLGQKQSARQCDCDFASSGDNVIPGHVLSQLESQTIMQPIEKMHNEQLWLFKYPEANKEYIISADVARGDGSDFSAFQIISIDDNQQVGEFKGKIPTKDYGQLIVRIAKMFNEAFVVVQNASIGWAVLQQIINQEYKNLYYHKKDYKYIDIQLHSKQRMNKRQQSQKDIVGFTTSSRTRPLIIDKMVVSLQSKQFIVHSKRLLNQLWTFIWLNGKPEAMKSYNDDLVMSLAIGLWVRYTSYIVKREARAFTKLKLNVIESGLHKKHQSQERISTGFFNNASNYNRSRNIFQIGQQEVDLHKFYFPKNK